jgi:hypothetical protein
MRCSLTEAVIALAVDAGALLLDGGGAVLLLVVDLVVGRTTAFGGSKQLAEWPGECV